MKHVLAVACAKMKSPEDGDETRVKIDDTGLVGGLLAFFFYNLVDFLLGFFNRLFNLCRLYAPVNNQIFKGHAGYLPTYRIKGRNGEGARRAVNNEFNPRDALKRLYHSSFFADYFSFNFIGGNGNRGCQDIRRDGIAEALN